MNGYEGLLSNIMIQSKRRHWLWERSCWWTRSKQNISLTQKHHKYSWIENRTLMSLSTRCKP